MKTLFQSLQIPKSSLSAILTAIVFFSCLSFANAESKSIEPALTYLVQTKSVTMIATVEAITVKNNSKQGYEIVGYQVSRFRMTYDPKFADKGHLTTASFHFGTKPFTLSEQDLEATSFLPIRPTLTRSDSKASIGYSFTFNTESGIQIVDHSDPLAPRLIDLDKFFRLRIKNRSDLTFNQILLFEGPKKVAFADFTTSASVIASIVKAPIDVLQAAHIRYQSLAIPSARTKVLDLVEHSAERVLVIRANFGRTYVKLTFTNEHNGQVLREVVVTKQSKRAFDLDRAFSIYSNRNVVKTMSSQKGGSLEFDDLGKLDYLLENNGKLAFVRLNGKLSDDVFVTTVKTTGIFQKLPALSETLSLIPSTEQSNAKATEWPRYDSITCEGIL